MSDDPYVYPGTTILRNKPAIRDAERLDAFERRMATQRAAEGIPTGDFDLSHLQAIHGHLFQDVYDWAGQIRIVELNKGGDQFMFRQYIQTGMADVHRRIVKADYFKGASQTDFAAGAGQIMGDVNYVHPFREGNGRTQLLYLKQLSIIAGYPLDLRRINPDMWIEASKRAHQAEYASIGAAIRAALERSA
jgi:cell filamentation protein